MCKNMQERQWWPSCKNATEIGLRFFSEGSPSKILGHQRHTIMESEVTPKSKWMGGTMIRVTPINYGSIGFRLNLVGL